MTKCHVCEEKIENGDLFTWVALHRAAYKGETFGWDLDRSKEVPVHGWCLGPE